VHISHTIESNERIPQPNEINETHQISSSTYFFPFLCFFHFIIYPTDQPTDQSVRHKSTSYIYLPLIYIFLLVISHLAVLRTQAHTRIFFLPFNHWGFRLCASFLPFEFSLFRLTDSANCHREMYVLLLDVTTRSRKLFPSSCLPVIPPLVQVAPLLKITLST